MTERVGAELQRRERMWSDLLTSIGSNEATPADIEAAGICPARTGQGIFRDLDNTRAIAPPNGVALRLLDLAGSYRDEFDAEGGLYHYPETDRGVRDSDEVDATKNAKRFSIPLFVVLPGSRDSTRVVHRGWVEDFDDASRLFLISFTEPAGSSGDAPDSFELFSGDARRSVRSRARPGQARFRYQVLKRYGPECAVCSLRVLALLEAVHIVPVERKGSDDPRNGLVLCRNHHRAFDESMIVIRPSDLAVLISPRIVSPDDLKLERRSLGHLLEAPHPQALAWRYEQVDGIGSWASE